MQTEFVRKQTGYRSRAPGRVFSNLILEFHVEKGKRGEKGEGMGTSLEGKKKEGAYRKGTASRERVLHNV